MQELLEESYLLKLAILLVSMCVVLLLKLFVRRLIAWSQVGEESILELSPGGLIDRDLLEEVAQEDLITGDGSSPNEK